MKNNEASKASHTLVDRNSGAYIVFTPDTDGTVDVFQLSHPDLPGSRVFHSLESARDMYRQMVSLGYVPAGNRDMQAFEFGEQVFKE